MQISQIFGLNLPQVGPSHFFGSLFPFFHHKFQPNLPEFHEILEEKFKVLLGSAHKQFHEKFSAMPTLHTAKKIIQGQNVEQEFGVLCSSLPISHLGFYFGKTPGILHKILHKKGAFPEFPAFPRVFLFVFFVFSRCAFLLFCLYF